LLPNSRLPPRSHWHRRNPTKSRNYVAAFDNADARGEGIFPLFVAYPEAARRAVLIFIVAKMLDK
jgi:hypothetical protein